MYCIAKSSNFTPAHWVVDKWRSFLNYITLYLIVLICQPPNVHVRISRILLGNAMAAVAVKKIY
jgi:hypothetical protein